MTRKEIAEMANDPARAEEFRKVSNRGCGLGCLGLLLILVALCLFASFGNGGHQFTTPDTQDKYQKAAEQGGCGSQAECDAVTKTLKDACGDGGYIDCK
jgi:hypothetical protein